VTVRSTVANWTVSRSIARTAGVESVNGAGGGEAARLSHP
jgi:hypothetical protein